MNRRKIKKRKWNLNRIKKINKFRSKRRLIYAHKGKKLHNNGNQKYKRKKLEEEIFELPNIFSIVENYEDTVKFLNSIIRFRKNKSRTRIYLDSQDVEYVGVEALMYLLAIVRDAFSRPNTRHEVRGNLPKNEEAQKVFVESGFLLYVKNNIDIKPNVDNIKISEGSVTKRIEPIVGKNLCDFVKLKAKVDNTKALYEIIIELMTNALQHAYDEENHRHGKWYLFAEERGSTIECVFLDTGMGIPYTINKNWAERIKILNLNKDSKYIESALKGEFRTQTKEENRGKGLPQISECARTELINELSIYSGTGKCEINDNSSYNLNDYKEKLNGTIVKWSIPKGEE